MKKSISLILALVMLALCFSACGKEEASGADLVIDLSANPVSPEGNIPDVPAKSSVRIDFIVPERGCLKLLSYDCTEYESYPENQPEAYVTFVDGNGNELYPEASIDYGNTEKNIFENGTVTAYLNFKNHSPEMKQFSLDWAYAPLENEGISVFADDELPALCVSDENGCAKFDFTAEKDALYSFICSEACLTECDCSFYIENEKGERVTDELDVHGTEWTARKAFLTKGNYVITVCEIPAVASVKAVTDKEYNDIITDKTEAASLPVCFGFNGIDSSAKSAVFTADGSQWLDVSAEGTGTYYDCSHAYTLKLTDSQGNEIILAEAEDFGEDFLEGDMRFDISHLEGEYTVSVSSDEPCVITITTK